MKKLKFLFKNNWKYFLCVLITILFTLLFLYGFKWLPMGSTVDFPTLIIACGVLVALISAIWSTNKQIRNQNKESHRPCIKVCDFKKRDYIKAVPFGLMLKNEARDRLFSNDYNTNTTSEVTLDLQLKNIGYGIADKIELFAYKDFTVSANYIVSPSPKLTREHYYLGVDDPKNIVVNFNYPIVDCDVRYNVYMLVMYSDLNDNIYSNMIVFNMNYFGQTKVCELGNHIFHDQNTKHFNDIISSIGLNYISCENDYKRRILGKG